MAVDFLARNQLALSLINHGLGRSLHGLLGDVKAALEGASIEEILGARKENGRG